MADLFRPSLSCVVSGSGLTMSDTFRDLIIESVCSHPPFIPLLEAGAEIEEIYTDGSSRIFGSQIVTANSCHAIQAGE